MKLEDYSLSPLLLHRMSSPSHGFMILNRLSSDNMHDLLSPDLQFRVESPFVLFKRNAGTVLHVHVLGVGTYTCMP